MSAASSNWPRKLKVVCMVPSAHCPKKQSQEAPQVHTGASVVLSHRRCGAAPPSHRFHTAACTAPKGAKMRSFSRVSHGQRGDRGHLEEEENRARRDPASCSHRPGRKTKQAFSSPCPSFPRQAKPKSEVPTYFMSTFNTRELHTQSQPPNWLRIREGFKLVRPEPLPRVIPPPPWSIESCRSYSSLRTREILIALQGYRDLTPAPCRSASFGCSWFRYYSLVAIGLFFSEHAIERVQLIQKQFCAHMVKWAHLDPMFSFHCKHPSKSGETRSDFQLSRQNPRSKAC